MPMDFTEAFCEAVKGYNLSFTRMECIRYPSDYWLCEVQFGATPVITARVRRTRSAGIETVNIGEKDFFRRIEMAFRTVSTFWYRQILHGTQWQTLVAVDPVVQRECSWVFGIDTAEKGALLLRMLLRGVLGNYSLASTPDREIRKSIVRRARNLPVYNKIVECTHNEGVLRC